jgi:hypothetical protein
MVSPGREDVGGAGGVDELEEEAHGVLDPGEVAFVGDFQWNYGAAVVGEVSVIQLGIVCGFVVVGWQKPFGDGGDVRLGSSWEQSWESRLEGMLAESFEGVVW